MKAAEIQCLQLQDTVFYQQGIGKLILRYDGCLILIGDYVEK
jgi:hypothetical protein